MDGVHFRLADKLEGGGDESGAMNEARQPSGKLLWRRRTAVVLSMVSGFCILMKLALGLPTQSMAAREQTAAQAGTILMQPTSTSIAVGESVTVEVWLEDVADYYGIDLRFTFDPDVVQVPSENVRPLWDIFDAANHWTLMNAADNDAGTVQYALTNLNPAEPFTGTGRVCSVIFSGLTSGTTPLAFYYAKGSTRRGASLYPTQIDGQVVVGAGSNLPPTANPDTTVVEEDSADNAVDVLANDEDPNGDDLTVASVTQPAHGSAAEDISAVLYTPDPDFCGSDVFTYTASDDRGGIDQASVGVTVTCLNDAPLADAAGPYSGYRTDVIILDGSGSSDVDSAIVSYEWQVDAGIVTSGPSTTHSLGLSGYSVGEHTVTLVVTDELGATDSDTAPLTVGNLAPAATDDSIETDEDTSAIIDVTDNDTDPDGTVDVETVTIVGIPEHGAVEVHPTTGVVTYTPTADYSGADAFSYTVRDDQGTASNEATVDVTIYEINDPPTANDDSAETGQGMPTSINVAANDSDVDGTVDSSTVSIVSGPVSGTATVNGSGLVTYAPSVDYAGKDIFTYTVRDDQGARSNEAAVTVTVNPAPVISSLAPASIRAGAPAFTLTVNGRNFVDDASVHWAGTPRPTTFVSSSQTLARISAADVLSEGTVDVMVVNPAPYGGASDALTFQIVASRVRLYLPLVSRRR
jgi:hypothetical protein